MPINEYFRMKNLFGGEQDENSSPAINPLFNKTRTPDFFPKSEENDSENEISALDQFRESVLNPPQRQNPGILRTLGTGALSALQGSENNRKPVYNAAGKVIGSKPMGFFESLGNKPFDVKESGDILNMPNEQRLADWKLKTGGLKEAATIESKEDINRALAAQRYAQAGVIPQRENRLQTQGDVRLGQGQSRIEQGQQGIEIRQQHQALDEWKTKNPEGKIYAPKGGNVTIINPRTGEATDTGINSGTLSDEQRIKLTGSNQLANTAAQGKNQLNLEDARNKGDLSEIAARGGESRLTKQAIPGKNTSTPGGDTDLLPSQQKTALQLRAHQYTQEHPEHADFIKIDPNTGMVDIEPPGTNWMGRASGPDKKTYDEMVAHMKGTKLTKGATPVEKKNNAAAPVKQDKGKDTVGSVTDKSDKSSGNKVITQRSPSTGKTRTSSDGGKTWTYN